MEKARNIFDESSLKELVINTLTKYIEIIELFEISYLFQYNFKGDPRLPEIVWEKTCFDDLIQIEYLKSRKNLTYIGEFHRNFTSLINGNFSITLGRWYDIKAKEKYGDFRRNLLCQFNFPNKLEERQPQQLFIDFYNRLTTEDELKNPTYYEGAKIQYLYYYIEFDSPISRNIEWHEMIDHVIVSHPRIRRISIDKFYELLTGSDFFYIFYRAIIFELIDEIIENRSIYFDKKSYIHKLVRSSNEENIKNFFRSLFITYEKL